LQQRILFPSDRIAAFYGAAGEVIEFAGWVSRPVGADFSDSSHELASFCLEVCTAREQDIVATEVFMLQHVLALLCGVQNDENLEREPDAFIIGSAFLSLAGSALILF
jgi:hypothetical protein